MIWFRHLGSLHNVSVITLMRWTVLCFRKQWDVNTDIYLRKAQQPRSTNKDKCWSTAAVLYSEAGGNPWLPRQEKIPTVASWKQWGGARPLPVSVLMERGGVVLLCHYKEATPIFGSLLCFLQKLKASISLKKLFYPLVSYFVYIPTSFQQWFESRAALFSQLNVWSLKSQSSWSPKWRLYISERLQLCMLSVVVSATGRVFSLDDIWRIDMV